MSEEPKIETRPEQPYVGVRRVMPMSEFAGRIPQMTATVAQWLKAAGRSASGPPFLRYHVIAMPERMDVSLGMPVDVAPPASEGVSSDAACRPICRPDLQGRR